MRHSLAFALCVIVIVALCGISRSNASTSADTAQSTPEQAVAPSFYGVALGERGAEVHARLGKPELMVSTNHGPTWAYAVQHETAWLVVLFQQGVVASINVLPQAKQRPHLIDPFGVRVGDSLGRMLAVRGRTPLFTEPNIYYYGQMGQPSWIYGVWNGAVASIGLTRGETNIPAIIADWRRDGTMPQRAIVLRVGPGKSVASSELAELEKTPCEDVVPWRLLDRHQITGDGETLDAVRVGCTGFALQRTFYFKVIN
jgi:hypothetical protein